MIRSSSRLNLLLLLQPCVAFATGFPALVTSVIDGDTIEVLHDNRAERTRLIGIDCPERGQAYGQKAKQAASELVFGKEVTLQTHSKDKYELTVVMCFS